MMNEQPKIWEAVYPPEMKRNEFRFQTASQDTVRTPHRVDPRFVSFPKQSEPMLFARVPRLSNPTSEKRSLSESVLARASMRTYDALSTPEQHKTILVNHRDYPTILKTEVETMCLHYHER